MCSISKRFPGVHALDNVDFDVRAGEVHAIMGQNGAGKSTLIKVLTGVHPRDGGTIEFEGRAFHAGSPAEAQKKGVSAVYQEVNLVPTLSVAENLFLGRLPRRWYGVDWNGFRFRAEELLERFDLDIDVREPLGAYPVAIQQMVAIARAVDIDARLIILDEPTSSLDAHETDVLFETMLRLKQRGLGIIFVTHFIDQVYRVSDCITVLRNGRRVGTFDSAELPRVELVAHMLGKPIEDVSSGAAGRAAAAAAETPTQTLLSARRLGRRGAIEPLDLDIFGGEVVGLAGLLGSGRTETARLLFGADSADCGTIEMGGKPARLGTPRASIAVGIALCPEDRKSDGVFPEMSVRANIALAAQRTLSRLGIVSRRAQDRIADQFVRKLDIATPDLDRPVKFLSGGNQQKVILARWLACNPLLLILDEPTRGIDVGAKVEVERLVEQLAKTGMAIIFISSELEEVVRRSHRVLVLRDRKVVGELTGEQISEQRIMHTIAGHLDEG